MRRFPYAAMVALGLLVAGEASAQFANRGLGAGLGYTKFNADPTISWGLPLTLEASLYIENGFDLTLRVPLMILTEQVENKQIIAVGGTIGVRYLFSEETLRPYVGAELAFLHIFRDNATSNFFGVGASGGIDYFVADSVSVGGRGFVNFYLALNAPVTNSLGAQAVVTTYF